jgi:polysaccharide biosynthesis protein PslH
LRILVCALDAPEPRTNGIRLAIGALLDELRKKHDIRYLSYRMSDQRALTEDEWIRLVDPPEPPIRGASLLRATLRRRPWEADRLCVGLAGPLQEELALFEPDIVHVTRWMLAGLGATIGDGKTVLTAFDAWHLNVEASLAVASRFRRPFIRAEARHIRLYEASEFARFDRVVVVSDEDKHALRELNPTLHVSVVPNGVDTDFFSPREHASVPNRIVFTGNMSYPPNIVTAAFVARELLPRVRAHRQDAHLVVVGRDPHPEVESLAALDGVAVTGEVADIRPWLTTASVYACPMLAGTGIKNKLLEAMASGLPCVVTPLALQGINARAEEEVLIGETAGELANHIVRVLDDDGLARRLRKSARAYVRTAHSWGAAAGAYETIYRELCRE